MSWRLIPEANITDIIVTLFTSIALARVNFSLANIAGGNKCRGSWVVKVVKHHHA